MTLAEFFSNPNLTRKLVIGDKVSTDLGTGYIAATEIISLYENDSDAYTRYGVKLDDNKHMYPNRIAYFTEKFINLLTNP